MPKKGVIKKCAHCGKNYTGGCRQQDWKHKKRDCEAFKGVNLKAGRKKIYADDKARWSAHNDRLRAKKKKEA